MESKPRRVIVITGANRGIGYELAKRLLKNPNKPIIVMTSRNETLGKEAHAKLADQFPTAKESLHYHVLDITKKETYGPFLDWIKEKFGQIDVLVNNAAILATGEDRYGYKANLSDATKVLGTNYFSTREFTEYVLPSLASDGKIINVSSVNGEYSWQGDTLHKKFTDLNFQPKDLEEIYNLYMETVKKQNFSEMKITQSPYNVSKALINAWTFHVLKNSLKGDQQAFSMDPGWCRTDMGGKSAPLRPEDGPVTIEYLIDLPFKVNKEINGKFFRDKEVVELR